MNVPNWWQATLLALAAWRIFQLLAHDTILEGPRRWLLRIPKDWDGESAITTKSYRETYALFLQCPYCAGFWITLAWVGAWWLWPHGTLVTATPFAIHAGMIGASKILSSEE